MKLLNFASLFLVFSFVKGGNFNYKEDSRAFTDPGISNYLSDREYLSANGVFIDNGINNELSLVNDEIIFDPGVGPITNLLLPNIGDPIVPFYTNISFLNQYFKNLNSAFIHNQYGSCGYTSISMLMSYYDTYWNGNIIESNYENGIAFASTNANNPFISPGVISVDVVRSTTTLSEYIDIQEQNNSFLWKLIQIGISKELYQRTSITSLSVNFDKMEKLLSGYCDYFSSQGYGNIEVHSVARTDDIFDGNYNLFRNSIISLLTQGIPVCLGGDCSGGSHQCVAYNYDSESDTIYGHLGYVGENQVNSYVDLDAFFVNSSDLLPGINDYFYLEIPDSVHHMHSNRFVTASGPAKCSCKLSTHFHSFVDIATSSNEYHMHQCICGYYNEEHRFRVYFDALKCRKCGFIYAEPNPTN